MTDEQNIRVAIAAVAMHALIPRVRPDAVARDAVAFADLLLAELAKPRPTV